jgi:thiol-disulfide isomerase/thioredoxin
MIERGRVRAPEIGRIWLNSPPLNLRQLRGRVVLIDFWDYTCVNCIRTLPYVQEWHRRYQDFGLVVIGVHTPEFTFAQYESNVERGIREFGLTYPIVIDSQYELWKAFANRYWPAKYLIDREGYIRYARFGEGGYEETEEQIQQLLLEGTPGLRLPEIMPPMRESDAIGAVCYRATPEIYMGYHRGRIGNEGGFRPDAAFSYSPPANLMEGLFYLRGSWRATAEYAELEGQQGSILLRYSAAGVNAVLACEGGGTVEVLEDYRPVPSSEASRDLVFNSSRSFIEVERPRMYPLSEAPDFGSHILELRCPRGLRAYAFTFTSCVDPVASAAGASEVAR